jgi:hypothetical protein
LGKKLKNRPLSYVNLSYYIESGVRTEDDREVLIVETVITEKKHMRNERVKFFTPELACVLADFKGYAG